MATSTVTSGFSIPGFEFPVNLYATKVLKINFNLKNGRSFTYEYLFSDGIGTGILEVAFVIGPGNPRTGTPGVSIGKGAYVEIIHDRNVISNSLEGSPAKKVATAQVNVSDKLWKLVFRNTNSGSAAEGEDYFVIITYPTTRPIKTKEIPMSFWQNAFDKFWNNYKPIDYLKIDYNHDFFGDQYSVAEMLCLIGLASGKLDAWTGLHLISAVSSVPTQLSTNSQFQKLSKYYSEFTGIYLINKVKEADVHGRALFVSKIQTIAFTHSSDGDFLREVYPHSVEMYELLLSYAMEDAFLKRSSHKVTISLKNEIAELYNHDSHFHPVKEIILKLPFLGTSGPLGTGGSVTLRNIKANNLNISTIKNSSSPGFKIKFSFETLGSISAETHASGLGLDSTSFSIHTLRLEPEVRLELVNMPDTNDPDGWGKRYILSSRLNFYIDPNLTISYPTADVNVSFNRDDLINVDVDAHWVTIDMNSMANQVGNKQIDSFLYQFIRKVMDYLLGEPYPVLDIKQRNDKMYITYVAKPEDENLNKMKQSIPYKIPAQNNLSKVDHIVIVMMENRSFDHMLGYLKLEGGRADVDGLNGKETNLDIRSSVHKVFHNRNTQMNEDPCHSTACVAQQMSDGMTGFVRNFVTKYRMNEQVWGNVMGYYGREEVPTFDYLSKQFSICDKWFCSHPGQTQPNRFITYTGKLNRNSNGNAEVDNIEFSKFNPIETLTVFDYLTRCNVTWKVFEHGYSMMRLFTNYTFDTKNVIDFNGQKSFEYLASIGNLPSVSFIEPDYIDVPPGNDDHPPTDIKNGQIFLAKILKALQESPKWEKTMLIITYDEHGGFYDHVVPPNNAIPLSPGITSYGPRVPAFVISPFVPERTVCHNIFDHTSILATIIRRFISPDVHRFMDLGPRISTINDVGSILSLASPRKNIPKVQIPQFNVTRLMNYKMKPPSLSNNDFHQTLFGYRLFMGFPNK